MGEGLDRRLKARLKGLNVRIDNVDENTFFLRNVPADEDCFNKPRTNVLVKRPCAGLPFLIGVDQDLAYRGPDRDLARVFSSGDCRQGWRVIAPGTALPFGTRDK